MHDDELAVDADLVRAPLTEHLPDLAEQPLRRAASIGEPARGA